MSAVDLAIIAILLVSLLVGLRRGFVREILSLLSWIVALWAGYVYALPVGDALLAGYIAQSQLRVIAAFAAIFVLVLIAASCLSHWLAQLLSVGGITGVDRSLGMLFGVVRGALIIAVLMIVAAFMGLAPQPWWQKSQLVIYFTPVAEMLLSLIPQGMVFDFQPRGGVR